VTNENDLHENETQENGVEEYIEPIFSVGSVEIPKAGPEFGIYITEFQTEDERQVKTVQKQLFASPRVIEKSGLDINEIRDGQLVQFIAHQDDDSMIKEIRTLPYSKTY
jgi:hypothetical protein